MQFPKHIWLLWLQGIDSAPEVVKECLSSWKHENPTWDVRTLDRDSLHDYFPRDFLVPQAFDNAPPPAFSDILRIYLISKFGGVWVDSTCFCTMPLDDWLHHHGTSQFFAYAGHRKDTPLSSWFLAATPTSHIAKSLCISTQNYWNSYPGAIVQRKPIYNKLKSILNQNQTTARIWLQPWLIRSLGCRPYFWFHYLFSKLYRTDYTFKKEWDSTPQLPVEPTHRLQNFGLLHKPSQDILNFIRLKQTYVHKLNWKLHKLDNYNPNEIIPPSSTLRTLLDMHKIGKDL